MKHVNRQVFLRSGCCMNRRASGAAEEAGASAVERKNEELIGALHSKISALKSVTVAINEEVHEQNKAADLMQTGMGSTENLLGSTLNRVSQMWNSGSNSSVMTMATGMVAAFFFCFYLSRWLLRE